MMTTVRRRVVSCLLALLTVVVLAQHRLSDGARRAIPDGTPDLWEQELHGTAVVASTHAARALDCPLILSLNRASQYRFTSVDDGVRFDLDADGDRERVSWPEAGSDVAFLALDHDGDGRITSSKELFGRHTVRGAHNGRTALMKLASDANGGNLGGAIDSQNPLFSRLLLWTDANHNGISEAAELRPALRALYAIGLGFGFQHRRDRNGNEFHYLGFIHIRRESGINQIVSAADDVFHRRRMYDACLVSRER